MGQNDGNNARPKLGLDLNEEASVKLLRDKPATGSSNYGPYFLYPIRHGGVEKSWFAPENKSISNRLSLLGIRSCSEGIGFLQSGIPRQSNPVHQIGSSARRDC
jgi:hypothetical protein